MKRYYEKYDAHYDDKKDIWLEEKCPDKDCEFCKDRPNKLSQVKSLNLKKLPREEKQ